MEKIKVAKYGKPPPKIFLKNLKMFQKPSKITPAARASGWPVKSSEFKARTRRPIRLSRNRRGIIEAWPTTESSFRAKKSKSKSILAPLKDAKSKINKLKRVKTS